MRSVNFKMPYKAIGNVVYHKVGGQWRVKQHARSRLNAVATVRLLNMIKYRDNLEEKRYAKKSWITDNYNAINTINPRSAFSKFALSRPGKMGKRMVFGKVKGTNTWRPQGTIKQKRNRYI